MDPANNDNTVKNSGKDVLNAVKGGMM